MSKSFYFLSLSLLVFLAALHPAHAGPNDPVNIPDANLRAAIESALGLSSGAPITEAQMLTLTTLDADGLGVADLTGLEHATALQHLDISSNPITDISILTQTNFPNLKSLDITDTWVRDFSALDGEYWTRKFFEDDLNNRLYICSNALENWDYNLNNEGEPLGKIDLNTFELINPDDWTASDRERIEEQLEKPTCAPVFTLTGDATSVRLVVDADADLLGTRGTISYVYRYRKSGESWPDTSIDTLTSQWTGGFTNPPPGEDGDPDYQGVIEKAGSGEYTAEITGLDPSAVYHFQVFGSFTTPGGQNRQIYPPGSKIQCWSTSEQSIVDCPLSIALQTGGVPTGGGGGGHSLSHLAFPGEVSFSELMFATDGGAEALPQWIEVCNASETRTLNLHGWRLEVEGRDSEGEYRYESITLRDLPIPPQQTALLVTSDAENTVALPTEQIYNLADHHPVLFRRNSTAAHRNKVLGETGLFLKLSDPYGSVSDVAGNLDGDRQTKDEPAWTLPDGMTDLGARTSLMRLYDAQGIPLDGSVRDTYVRAADVVLEVESYYGTATDVGNPSYKNGWAFPPGQPERLYFSELMLTSKGGLHSLPQWIELYNASETEVDLRDWQLKIETLDASGQRRHAVIKLARFLIPPGQTAVLVSEIGRSSRSIRPYVQHFAMQGKRHRDRNTVFGQTGFFLKLYDPDGRIHDIAGNLDGIQGTADAPRWELPAGMTPDGARTSLIRRYYRAAGILLDGKSEENWIPASALPLEVMTYYGHSTDIGNPGYVNDARRIRGPAVSFSELMFTESRGRRSLPAWIEIYNGSESPVDLRDYQLEIEARDANAEHRHDVITFQRFSIPAHQTAVLVTSHGWHSPDLPRDRIYALYRRMPAAFRQVPNQILGESGFFLKLSDPEGQVSDVVGNLDGDKRTKDPPTWQRPTGQTESGARTSLMRRYHEIGMPFDGRVSENWRTASEMRLEVSSYYGKETDIGNPGYTNQQRGIPGHQVSFSELMLTSKGGLHSLPQWIELYNDSEIEVDLRDWQLHIEARDAAGEHRHGIITLKNLLIPANQTALLVTRQGRSSREILRETVYNLSVQKVFDRNAVLGQNGFFLKLLDPEGQVSDTAGNLDGDRRTQDTPAWQLPTGKTEEGHRTSLMRRYYHVTGIPLNGRLSENWVPASQLPLQVMTYWGKETDIGNPGHRGGGPLPVRLSRFHPVRDKATGHVKITWVTESELNNAGFNILRSETQSGGFKVINVKGLIAGHGTTNEKHVYTFTDTTAKPNVVYYYRLEDVSLAGQQTLLATTRVRGNIVAAGKLMTLWGDLKKSR